MESWERSFIKTHLETLSSLPIRYPDNYEQPPSNWLHKVATFPVDLPPPPPPKPSTSSSTSTPMKLTFKSTKPHATFTLKVLPTDTIASVKEALATLTGAPPADVQRLLSKGKALNDSKLLKEYGIAEGDTINLMTKPGYVWESSAGAGGTGSTHPPISLPTLAIPTPMEGVERTSPRPRSTSRSHSRNPSLANVPELMLSPTPHSTPQKSSQPPAMIPLTLDTSITPPPQRSGGGDTYVATISKPEFWGKLHEFLKNEFETKEDANLAIEEFLVASKGHLTAHEIAKIRDSVGLFSMGGI